MKDKLLSIIIIGIIVIFPHLGLIPNFGYSIPILFIAWLHLKSSKETFSDIGFSFKRIEIKSIIVGSFAAVLALCFMQLIFFPIFEYFITIDEAEAEIYEFIRGNIWQYVFMVIMGWLIGGLYEEIVFHGFIFSRLEHMIQSKYATTISFIITAIIFGAYHYQLGILDLINATLVGVVYLALFLYYKRNLWYSIICHGVYNTIVITLIYFGYL